MFERVARVAAGPLGDQRRPAPPGTSASSAAAPRCDDRDDVLARVAPARRPATRQQRRVDLEVRVLGGRADQRDHALLDRRQQRVLLRLVEAVDLVEEQDRALARCRRAGRGRGRSPRAPARPSPRPPTAPRTRHRSSSRRSRASVVFPLPGGPKRIIDETRSSSIARRSTEPSPRICSLADELVEHLRAQAERERRHVRAAARGRRRRRGRSRAEVCSRAALATSPDTQDELARSSPDRARRDYERYLRTDELLALQKPEDERAHHDELLFQTVHQSSELWLKLAWTEGELAARAPARGRARAGDPACCAARSAASSACTRRSTCSSTLRPGSTRATCARCSATAAASTRPASATLRRVSPELGAAFHEQRREAGLEHRRAASSAAASSRISTPSPSC